ncbi:MAG TPA: hypothetical protein DDZ51_02880 [Planctomycetaceae bacterium]|nr:hypothetical protein [Planctomycetaceae bacterium]
MLAKKVVWVEASPVLFASLSKNIQGLRPESNKRSFFQRLHGNVQTEHLCVNALIGDEDANEVDFHIYDNDGKSNSVFQIDRSTSDYDFLNETGEVLKMPVKELDSALSEVGIRPEEVDVLVVDTQGAELLCLKGASKLLANARYVEAEVSTRPVYQGGVLLTELDTWLSSRGFRRKTIVRRHHMNSVYKRIA